ncbi:hypothetical protein DAPK24_006970 [Pichia kluyveri]|uniref:Uncharacterized protein n=1 Tax=Pichia kluyveri TaxID=36015 RepID=A0AAV5QZC1_PICKL|nr:hypothetical protein DAPK24_006970 [Pichia kluyveri]
MLATVGAGVDVYFTTGDLMLTPDTPDVLSAQIQGILTLIIQSILHCTVAASILDKFETDAAIGFELLTLIRRRYSHISARELAALVDSAVDARTKDINYAKHESPKLSTSLEDTSKKFATSISGELSILISADDYSNDGIKQVVDVEDNVEQVLAAW